MIRDDGGGAAGGWEWYVYIVGKGMTIREGKAHPVFNAGTLTGEKLAWKQEHLLEIEYDVAYINQFKNVWGSADLNSPEDAREIEYLVEIRLAPSGPDFSILTPSGNFRSKK